VSSTGSDSANCDRPTPCASFAGAYNKTNAGGEITCADSGDFGGALISKSLTINCESSIGSNTEGSTNFITITGTSITVTVRGLDLDGEGGTNNVSCTGSGANVNFVGSGTLHLQKMKINNLTGSNCGVQFSATGSATLDITDCDITDNGGSGLSFGIYLQPRFWGNCSSLDRPQSHQQQLLRHHIRRHARRHHPRHDQRQCGLKQQRKRHYGEHHKLERPVGHRPD
jgi:hypothetical protein